MMSGQTPIFVLKEGTKRERGQGALGNNIAAAKAIADAVRTTLGPRGMDKMLVDSMGDIVVTNDGVTILKEMDVEHPAAKMLVEVAKTQDQEAATGRRRRSSSPGNSSSGRRRSSSRTFTPRSSARGYRLASRRRTRSSRRSASRSTSATSRR